MQRVALPYAHEPGGSLNWLEAVRLLPDEAVVVVHNPPTRRYARAHAKRTYILRESLQLGERPHDFDEDAVEIAMWAPSPRGQQNGFYSCMRLFLDSDRRVEEAAIYCFYDGTETSPGFRTFHEARQYALTHGFQGAPYEEDD